MNIVHTRRVFSPCPFPYTSLLLEPPVSIVLIFMFLCTQGLAPLISENMQYLFFFFNTSRLLIEM
uniref:PRO0875 n=1 Tax=Homo sapiens TaxID=9606 RepID=Q96JR3_HUMAN|nr:PRO0875 [Homo sapiens]